MLVANKISDDSSTINSFHGKVSDLILDNRNDQISSDQDLVDDEDQRGEIMRILTSNVHQEGGVFDQIQSLSKTLSQRTNLTTNTFNIDINDFDLQKILRKFVRMSDVEDIHIKKAGIIFKNVNVYGQNEASSFSPDILSFLNIYQNIKTLKNAKNNQKQIIKNINGIVKPGEMCLVLGKPGSGCSTLLKTVAGEASQYSAIDADIKYDTIPQDQMMKYFKADVIYNPENDAHFPHLTVEQTLRFAITCKVPKLRIKGYTRDQYINALMDILTTVFGLNHVRNTKVGDDFVRGVSGGERKRVSIAEALASRACIYCWDNATRGLDSSTALEYAQAIRIATNFLKHSSLVTLYQAGERIYETFDKVTILYDGYQIYFGPIEQAKRFFENMGYASLPRQSTTEFLTGVTDSEERIAKPGFENKVPRTAQEFEDYWLKSQDYQNLITEINEYEQECALSPTQQLFDESTKQAKMKFQRHKSKYTINLLEQFKLLTIRGFQRVLGDPYYTVIQIFSMTVESLVIGSMFYNLPNNTDSFFSRGGLLFFATFLFTFTPMVSVINFFQIRFVLLKQKAYTFYHPGAEAIASTLADIPLRLTLTVILSLIVYFLSNLERKAGKFFIFFLFLFVTYCVLYSLFLAFGVYCANISTAKSVTGLALVVILVYTGYVIQRPAMHWHFKWLSYINPVTYSFEAVVANEFHGRRMDCSTLVPSGPGYEGVSIINQACVAVGSNIGENYVLGDDYASLSYGYEYSHLWRNFGILIGFWVFFLVLTIHGMEILKLPKGGGERLLFKKGTTESAIASKIVKDDIESGERLPSDKIIEKNESSDDITFNDLKGRDTFMWKNIDYEITVKGDKKVKLLDNIFGYVKPGTLTALMGESGAGKTTLLNVLSERVNVGVVSGDILVNGKDLDSSFKRSTGYVQQQDLHIAELTVRESLQFAARLRRPTSVSEEEKMDYVEKIIDVLQMRSFANAVVGKVGSGLNVEQRKKLSIGVELVAKPSLLLFLDEPTSGLDFQSAWAIVKLLRRLADAGQCIICTIHQPSATLFEQFDRLLLLKKGGQTVYFGDIGSSSNVVLNYFEKNGARRCSDAENPAEYILDVIGAGATSVVNEDWNEKWINSTEFVEENNQTDLLIRQGQSMTNTDDAEKIELKKTFATPYSTQLKHVLVRTFRQFYRDPTYVVAKFSLLIFGGLFFGWTFFNLKTSFSGLQNAVFCVFLSIGISFPLIGQIQERAIDARELFEARESSSNTYHWSTLLISQLIAEIPYSLVGSAIFFCCLYFTLKVNNSPEFAGYYYLMVAVIFPLFYISFGLWIVYFLPDLASAEAIYGLLFTFMFAFAGIVQPYRYIPTFWKFMYRVSPLTYFVQSLTGALLHGVEVRCVPKDYTIFNPPEGQTCIEYSDTFVDNFGGYIANPNDTENCEYCVYTTGDQFMANFNIEWSDRWRNFGLIWVFIVFNVFAMLVFYRIFRVKKSLFKRKHT
ncbi:ATP dependent transporter multidrug resistance [Ascoidea rubescens DSM 1968]|uniref:ATP dependent transporter multidrug resistance n=1 Tax=Ascoidea rubescens DSM 1968 TaxID=1344418 RepID=A0A1D2VB25_9ASCO|nr:ATP dependent transporter multidrug resistance [Ascoidea rubescens DSM 1968]ODV58800.1 ATP dependent transporter multidrug resistance [Ascoidea rubescens DSM 1968]